MYDSYYDFTKCGQNLMAGLCVKKMKLTLICIYSAFFWKFFRRLPLVLPVLSNHLVTQLTPWQLKPSTLLFWVQSSEAMWGLSMPGPTAYERRDLMHRFIHLFIFTYARTATVVEMPLFVFIKALGAARSMWGTVCICVCVHVCVCTCAWVCLYGRTEDEKFHVFFLCLPVMCHMCNYTVPSRYPPTSSSMHSKLHGKQALWKHWDFARHEANRASEKDWVRFEFLLYWVLPGGYRCVPGQHTLFCTYVIM